MKLFLIRHGEPTYAEVRSKGYKGHGMDLAPLTEKGIQQAKKAAKDESLKDAEIIISSPYTRALQTAAIISKELGLDILVENDIHEWIPDLTFNFNSETYLESAVNELIKYKGEYPENQSCAWEPLSSLAERAAKCLKKYLGRYEKVIVVSHGMLMRQLKYKQDVDYCEIIEMDFDENYKWEGWIDD